MNNLSKLDENIKKQDHKDSKINIKNNSNDKDELLSVTDKWNDILDVIRNQDKRLFGLLENVAIINDENKLTFDLKDKGNDFIKKTLLEKSDLINNVINDIVKKKYIIKVKFDIQNNDKIEENHPLLDKIKNKFDGEIIKQEKLCFQMVIWAN